MPKAYRHPTLEAKLTNARLSSEAKILAKAAKAGVKVPVVYEIVKNEADKGIWMSHVNGSTVKKYITELFPFALEVESKNENQHMKKLQDLCKNIAIIIATLHDSNIIHGDLTTSNFMIDENEEINAIDFGLSFISGSVEDKAVDLYVMERAFNATHPQLSSLLVL